MRGLVHIYCGDGKGKTTAAVGLAVRAKGAGKKVLFVQFFKDGTSSEVAVLRDDLGIDVRFISAANFGIVPEQEILDFIACRPEGLEIVMTGRDPSPALCGAADYITEMNKLRHPYDEGVMGRKGIEF